MSEPLELKSNEDALPEEEPVLGSPETGRWIQNENQEWVFMEGPRTADLAPVGFEKWPKDRKAILEKGRGLMEGHNQSLINLIDQRKKLESKLSGVDEQIKELEDYMKLVDKNMKKALLDIVKEEKL